MEESNSNQNHGNLNKRTNKGIGKQFLEIFLSLLGICFSANGKLFTFFFKLFSEYVQQRVKEVRVKLRPQFLQPRSQRNYQRQVEIQENSQIQEILNEEIIQEEQQQKQSNECNKNFDHQNKNEIQKNNDELKDKTQNNQNSNPELSQVNKQEDQNDLQIDTQQQNVLDQQEQQIQQDQQQKIQIENEEVQQDDFQQNQSDQQQEPVDIQQQSKQISESENRQKKSQKVNQQKYLTEETQDLLNQIANRSYKGRNVDVEYQYFIGQACSIQDTIKHYFGRSQNKFAKQIKQFKKEIIGHINIRGDGNCFYTAFIYQYLSLLIKDQQRKDQFLNQIKEISVCIQYQNIKIDQNKEIVQEFIQQFQQLENKQELLEQMKNPDYLFYQLTIIVFRSYFSHIYQNSQELVQFGDLNIMNDLLTWEQECNNNEILINALVEHLKLHLILYFIDIKNNSYERKEYMYKKQNEDQEIDKIFLLLSPGHYQIAIPL